ncbi:MAG: phosphoribosyltransferase family protein [Myxococcota bacterium]
MTALFDTIFPEDCQSCGAPAGAGGLCGACDQHIPGLLSPFDAPPSFRTAWALGGYDGPLGDLIRRGKYRPDPMVFRRLGQRLAQAANGRLPRVDAVCWVSVPRQRRWKRGFDQSEMLARPVARVLGVPMFDALIRVNPEEQAGRMRHERAEGARGAFRLRPSLRIRPLPRAVLLIDDVVTTGSTARACGDELLAGGVRRAHLLCVAGAHV